MVRFDTFDGRILQIESAAMDVGGNTDASTSGDAPVTVRYRLTLPEVRQSYRVRCRYADSPLVRYGMGFLCGISMLAGIGLLFTPQIMLGCICLLLALGWLFRERWTPFLIGFRFGRLPGQNVEIEWQIAPEELQTHTTLGDSRFSWRVYIKAIRAPEGLALLPRENLWHWLPRHAFANDGEFERVVGWAERHIKVHGNR